VWNITPKLHWFLLIPAHKNFALLLWIICIMQLYCMHENNTYFLHIIAECYVAGVNGWRWHCTRMQITEQETCWFVSFLMCLDALIIASLAQRRLSRKWRERLNCYALFCMYPYHRSFAIMITHAHKQFLKSTICLFLGYVSNDVTIRKLCIFLESSWLWNHDFA